MSFISSFEIIKGVVPDPRSFLFIAASVTDEVPVSPSIPREVITDFNKGNHFLSNGPKSLSRYPPNCIILDN